MNRQELAQHLYGLADGTILPQDRSRGLCVEVAYLEQLRGLPFTLAFDIKSLMKKWPKFSGSAMYPVPHAGMGPISAFLQLDDLWGPDQYGDDRRDMCRFIADKLMELADQ